MFLGLFASCLYLCLVLSPQWVLPWLPSGAPHVLMWSGKFHTSVVIFSLSELRDMRLSFNVLAFLQGTPGFSTAQKLDKLGMRGSNTCELIFEDCKVPGKLASSHGSMHAGWFPLFLLRSPITCMFRLWPRGLCRWLSALWQPPKSWWNWEGAVWWIPMNKHIPC